jgi:hypothetical protein
MTDQPEPVDLSAPEAERDAALERVRELTEWRTMESAPRDGDAILLLEYYGDKVLAYWSTDADAWVSASGYGSHFWADDDYYNGWLPLPPAP